jgi:Tfp pilus assembly protein PilV
MKSASTGLQAVCPQPRSTDAVPSSSEAGFTLFETLTAMLVLSIGLVSLFEAHSRALRTAGAAADYARARIFAQGLLADTVSGWNGKLISKSGNDDGFAWSIDVAPEGAAWANVAMQDNWKLRRVRVIVNWAGGHQFELNSLKLGRTNG